MMALASTVRQNQGQNRDLQRVVQDRVYAFIRPLRQPNIWGKCRSLSPAFSLRSDLSMSCDEYDHLMNDYFLQFGINADGYDHLVYFPEDIRPLPMKIINYLGRWTGAVKSPQPLTLGMLVEAAVTGRWVGQTRR